MKLSNDRYMWATLPAALALFFRGFVYLLAPDNIVTAAASKIFILSWGPDELSQIVWMLVGLALAFEALGFIKPLWAQALIRGVGVAILLDLEVYANYLTFFVPGTPFLIGALVAHWAITIVWLFALIKLPIRQYVIDDNMRLW